MLKGFSAMDDNSDNIMTDFTLDEIKALRVLYRQNIYIHRFCTVIIWLFLALLMASSHSGFGSYGYYNNTGDYIFYSNIVHFVNCFAIIFIKAITGYVQHYMMKKSGNPAAYMAALTSENIRIYEDGRVYPNKRQNLMKLLLFALIVFAGLYLANDALNSVHFMDNSIMVKGNHEKGTKYIDYDKIFYVSVDEESFNRVRVCFQWNDKLQENGRDIILINLGAQNENSNTLISEIRKHYSGDIKYSKEIPIKLN